MRFDIISAEKQSFLESELENNQEMEKKISMEERNAAKFRLDLQEHENIRSQLQNEVPIFKICILIFMEFPTFLLCFIYLA